MQTAVCVDGWKNQRKPSLAIAPALICNKKKTKKTGQISVSALKHKGFFFIGPQTQVGTGGRSKIKKKGKDK